MDRRQQKTRSAIFNAFNRLLEKKHFNHITVQEKITHLLYHLKDNKGNVLGVLSGESGELFMRYFKEYLGTMFEQYPDSIKGGVPKEFAMNHLVGSFSEAVKWWIGERMEMPPEEMADHYLKLIGYPH